MTGLNEPWDVVAIGVQLYVSDRMNHAIKVFDMDTGLLVKSIPVVQPEGLALLDGWLYYGSIATKSIRKINLATGQNVLIADPTVAASKFSYFIDGNSSFMKIAVSDGSFGPRGMVAYTTWSNRNFGYPNLIDGTTGASIDFLSLKPGETFRGTNPLGLSSYSSAVGIGAGRMLFGTAEEGLHVVSQALPSDPVIDMKAYQAGMDEWQARGYGLTHGPAGYGYYGLPLPWGVSPQIDYFLKANLHGGGLPAGGGLPPRHAQRYGVAFDRGIWQCHARADQRSEDHPDLEQRHGGRHQHGLSFRAREVRQVRYVRRQHAQRGRDLHDRAHLHAHDRATRIARRTRSPEAVPRCPSSCRASACRQPPRRFPRRRPRCRLAA